MLNDEIKAAYDAVEPDEIARARMLEAILTKNKDQTEPIRKGVPQVRIPKWLVGTLGAVAAVWLVIALPQPKAPAQPETPERPVVQSVAPPEKPLVAAPPAAVETPSLPEQLEWEDHLYTLVADAVIEPAELGAELAPHQGGAIRSLRNRDACQAIALVTPEGSYLYQRPCDKHQGD